MVITPQFTDEEVGVHLAIPGASGKNPGLGHAACEPPLSFFFFPWGGGGVAKGQLPRGQRELLRAKQAVEIPDVKFTSANFKQHLFKH